jgi:hypothetical protein
MSELVHVNSPPHCFALLLPQDDTGYLPGANYMEDSALDAEPAALVEESVRWNKACQ